MPSVKKDREALVEAPASNASQTAKDLFAGAAGGVAQVLIGQPFDIVKVRLQTTTQHSSALECATRILKDEGAAAFYKGTLTPLVGIGACVSIQFGAFHAARRFFEGRNSAAAPLASALSPAASAPLSYSQYYLSGAFAGLSNSALSGPIEHVRIRLQTQPHVADPAHRLYNGPIGCIRTLVSRAGVANGLYRGQAVTLIREAQAYGVWFLTYEFLMQGDVRRRGLSGRDQVEAWRLALYGGLAGEALWLASYPFDVVKSKMQTDGFGAGGQSTAATAAKGGEGGAGRAAAVARMLGEQKYANMRDCFGQTYANEGLAGFWRGIGPTLLRAMPVSAATFFVAEMTLRLIS